VKFGDLRRTSPLSSTFGFDRGTPVDRYYIHEFLQRNSAFIQGRVLEVVDNGYTLRFGGASVLVSDVVDLDPNNPLATFVDDLAVGTSLPSDAFDCVVLTQVLQLVYDVPAVLRTLYRILKPGGVLLVTVPGITQVIEKTDGVQDTWYWSFTRRSATRLFEEQFSPGYVSVDVSGNVLSAASFLYGMAAEELTPAELNVKDASYPVVLGVRAIKKPGSLVESQQPQLGHDDMDAE
jgi:SAM-dependent methyltransferase